MIAPGFAGHGSHRPGMVCLECERLGQAALAEQRPAVSDAAFMVNVREALTNGYDRLCAHCGIGTAGDDHDIHERGCPEFDESQLR